MKPFQITAEIIANKNIKKNYFEIVLYASYIAQHALPGQFVNVKVSDGIEPLLRRPLSIHKISHRSTGKEDIVMLYEVVGKGTEILSQRRAGECLDMIGPLGNGFSFNRGLSTVNRRPFLIAGGMGTAPLVFLAQRLKNQETRDERRRTMVLIGAKTRDSILCEKEFKELGCDVKIATDDGSRGFKGYVSELLDRELSALSFQPSAIYACGPKLLLKEISRISIEHAVPAQLSLESHMACGIGACMGCVIKAANRKSQIANNFEYKRVCKEGPVFEASQVVW